MADLIFKYGSMGSSKTAQALMLRFDYIENNKKVLFLKPSTDNRDGETIVKSRIGIKADAKIYNETDEIAKKFIYDIIESDVIIVDEAQFSTERQIEELKVISEELNKTVYCFGLRTDFKTNMFPGSKRLFELATIIEEIPKKCECGNSAIVNARFNLSGIVYEGEQVEIGSNDKYKAICYKCYRKGRL